MIYYVDKITLLSQNMIYTNFYAAITLNAAANKKWMNICTKRKNEKWVLNRLNNSCVCHINTQLSVLPQNISNFWPLDEFSLILCDIVAYVQYLYFSKLQITLFQILAIIKDSKTAQWLNLYSKTIRLWHWSHHRVVNVSS